MNTNPIDYYSVGLKSVIYNQYYEYKAKRDLDAEDLNL